MLPRFLLHRSVLKKSYRIWLAVLVVGAFFVFFGELALDRTLNSALLRTLLQDKIGALLGLTFDYRDVHISFLPLGIEFHDIKAHDEKGQEFYATQATADLSWWSLFMGTPKVGNFRIVKPVVRIVRSAERGTIASEEKKNLRWHWPQLVTDRLERISISNPDVHLGLTSSTGQRHLLKVQGGELQFDFRPVDKVLITLHIDSINYRHNEKQRLQDLSLAAEGELGTQGFAFHLERLHANNIEQLQGEVQGNTAVDEQGTMTAPLQVHGDFTLRGDLALLDDLLNIKRSHGQSTADFNLTMRFAPQQRVDFKAAGRAKVTQGVLGGIKLHNSEAHLTVTPQQLRFKEGKLVVAGKQRGAFQGMLSFAKPIIFDFSGKITSLPLAELMSTFNTKLNIFNFDITSQNVRVHGQGKPFSLHVRADTQLADWQIHKLRNHSTPPVCAMQLNLHSNRKRLHFKHLHGTCTRAEHDSGKIALHGTIAYGKGQLDLHVDAPALNLAATSFLVPEELHGQGKIKSTISGAGEAIVVQTQLDLRQVQLNKEKIGDMVGRLNFHRRLVAWHDVRLRPVQGGEVQSPRGTLNYGDLRFDAQFNASNVSAQDMQHLLRRRKSTAVVWHRQTFGTVVWLLAFSTSLSWHIASTVAGSAGNEGRKNRRQPKLYCQNEQAGVARCSAKTTA